MKRIAFFVEGQTEQIFVNRIIRYLLGPKNTNIIQRRVKGGTNIPKQEITRHRSLALRPDYEVLIVDCGSDNRVKSEMLDNLENLSQNNYKYLIGLRDLYPLPLDELDRLERGLRFLPPRLKKLSAEFDVIVAVREIETWFMSDTSHYQKVDKKLTGDFIQRKLGFDPYVIDPVAREHPARDLNNIYRLVGQSYAKRYDQTVKMVNKLDIKYVLGPMREKIEGLDHLIAIIDKFKEMEDDDKEETPNIIESIGRRSYN